MSYQKLSEHITVISNRQSSNIYYLNYDVKVLIDTGHYVERDEIIEDLKNAGIKLKDINYILITHGHVDHVGNCAFFKQANPNIVITVSNQHEYFRSHLKDFNSIEGLDSQAEWYNSDLIVSDKYTIQLDDQTSLTVINTPGHTSDGISFWCDSENVLFSGDTIYNGVIPQLDIYQPLPLGLQMLTDSYSRLQDLPIRMICPGHGHPILNVNENFTVLNRKLRKFSSSPDLLIINNLIPTVEHYINDHPGVTKQHITDYFEIKYNELFDKGFADFDKPVSAYPIIINKVIMMMEYLSMIAYSPDGVVYLTKEINHHIKA